jgi:hypothetical protein
MLSFAPNWPNEARFPSYPWFYSRDIPKITGTGAECRLWSKRNSLKGSGHLHVKIYSKPEALIMPPHTAKTWSVFHTVLRSL